MKKIGIAIVGLGPGSEPHLASLAALKDRVDVRSCVTKSGAPQRQALLSDASRARDHQHLGKPSRSDRLSEA